MSVYDTDTNSTHHYISYHVSLNGKHLFRTEQNVMGYDIPTSLEATLAEKFPASEGYKVSREVRMNGGSSSNVAN